ncbi:DUF4349 domain-containing protein [Leptospira borgpetersenii serovar Hardjo-bovis]|nr:Conserved hypothetical protein [Leptospira borgpetersenii serovar Hardjo-bovis str. L550]AMX59625.1 hypothetical protein LBK6_15245 [Leptospira borgpetersenii serovar Hardjo]AWV71332.1 hypothetical protein B9T54_16335 [Leptospira borgpetersenii serovar Hardjo-bovis]TQE54755.1 DUF4349 domain-containing protein [Leptospira borgpetersenii]AMX62853.1 hypothetical protein LBK9_15165 [Leptospira borgpetersenii serovar Hardjo]
MFLPYRLILPIVLFLVQCSAHRLANAEGAAIGTQNEPNVIDERKISYTAYVTLNVGNLEESKNKIKSLIKNYKGFITRISQKSALVRVPYKSERECLPAKQDWIGCCSNGIFDPYGNLGAAFHLTSFNRIRFHDYEGDIVVAWIFPPR